MSWLGLDIGGANLKAANAQGWACSQPFALWREPHGLAAALESLVGAAPMSDKLAVTMTGELCDCFCSKAEGVGHILQAVENVAGGRKVAVYLVDGRFVSIEQAKASPQLAAASNWHALATYAARYVQRNTGLLIDIGSTTTDVIPISDGQVIARGRTDTERLLSRELIYGGVGRTPVCAVACELPLGDELCPVAAEVFATTADAYLLLGYLSEDPAAMSTADGRGLTRDFARRRLARQLCADCHELADSDFVAMARAILESQLAKLKLSIETIAGWAGDVSACVLAGEGEFLALMAVERSSTSRATMSLKATMGPSASRSAPAFATAVLAQEGRAGN
jgi:probable H4MPT-linked C1 transfer pathway protein